MKSNPAAAAPATCRPASSSKDPLPLPPVPPPLLPEELEDDDSQDDEGIMDLHSESDSVPDLDLLQINDDRNDSNLAESAGDKHESHEPKRRRTVTKPERLAEDFAGDEILAPEDGPAASELRAMLQSAAKLTHPQPLSNSKPTSMKRPLLSALSDSLRHRFKSPDV